MPIDRLTRRPIAQTDLAFLAELYASTRQEELALTDWSEAQKHAFLAMQFDAQHRYYQEHYADACFELLLVDDDPVGRLYVARREAKILIIDIALLPAHRGQGIGGSLLRELLAEAGASGKAVRIHVEQNNPALGLYRQLGFRHIDDHGVYYLMEWHPATSPKQESQDDRTT